MIDMANFGLYILLRIELGQENRISDFIIEN